MRAKYTGVLGPFASLCDHDVLITAGSSDCGECEAEEKVMGVIWGEDPIIDGDELCHEQRDSLDCELCGEVADRLYDVEDNDTCVGYRSTLRVCGSCLGGAHAR